jgi:hypothetical protein
MSSFTMMIALLAAAATPALAVADGKLDGNDPLPSSFS